MTSFSEANKTVHKVEDQWHYTIMIKYGWIPDTLIGIGFVRTYNYYHPELPNVLAITTGSRADYWSDTTVKEALGYWSKLEPYLKTLKCGYEA